MRKIIILIACALPFLGACTPVMQGGVGSAIERGPSGGDVHIQPVGGACTEDMPCWDCHTHGNLICGTDAYVVVALDGYDVTTDAQRGAAIVDHELHVCAQSFIDCHVERDTDGVLRVYGKESE